MVDGIHWKNIMQYNYYSLYNITEARASDKHYARMNQTRKDLEARFGSAQWMGKMAEKDGNIESSKRFYKQADDINKIVKPLHEKEILLKNVIRDRKSNMNSTPELTERQKVIQNKIKANKERLEVEKAKKAAAKKKAAAEKKAAAKKKAAQHKTKIQQHGRKQKVGAVLAGSGFTGAGALLNSAHDDVTE